MNFYTRVKKITHFRINNFCLTESAFSAQARVSTDWIHFLTHNAYFLTFSFQTNKSSSSRLSSAGNPLNFWNSADKPKQTFELTRFLWASLEMLFEAVFGQRRFLSNLRRSSFSAIIWPGMRPHHADVSKSKQPGRKTDLKHLRAFRFQIWRLSANLTAAAMALAGME